MTEFPANSRTAKSVPTRVEKEEPKDKKPTDEKKIEKVTSNDVVRRKPALGKRLRENFGGDDANKVMDYILMDVLIPAAKDTLVDAVTQGFERLIFGENRSPTRRAATARTSSAPGHVSYNRFAPSSSAFAPKDEARPTLSRQARVNHNFDEVVLQTRAEAEEVIDRMYDVLSRYDSVSVADLYDLIGVTSEYTDRKWGWTALTGSGVSKVRHGYLLDLPKPEPVEA